MATDNPTDYLDHTFELARLRERIAHLEEDRSALMAAIRHMRRGRLDGRYLTDALRAGLARSPDHGVLLETTEVEIRCLRQRATDLESNKRTLGALRVWQEVDQRLNSGALSAEEAVEAAWDRELVRRTGSLNLAHIVSGVHVCEPSRDERLVPGPILVIDFKGHAFGGPRIFRPVSDELRWDTGLFS